jgi:hypothetical protein
VGELPLREIAMSYKDLVIMDSCMDVKETFGSFAILDDLEPVDIVAVHAFARVVRNYIKMKEIDENTNTRVD